MKLSAHIKRGAKLIVRCYLVKCMVLRLFFNDILRTVIMNYFILTLEVIF